MSSKTSNKTSNKTSATNGGSNVAIYTTRCDPSHCFSQVKPGGLLCSCVERRGTWIPCNLGGMGTVAFSNLRVWYLGLCLAVDVIFRGRKCDVVVIDVLPTALPLLKLLLPSLPLCFYCHFPDKYLVRNTVNGVQVSKPSLARRIYRYPMDKMEEVCMSSADVVGVNSEFTRGVFRDAFLGMRDVETEVLYPAINLEDFIPPKGGVGRKGRGGKVKILSMNRFERKKNVGLSIQMLGVLKTTMAREEFERIELVIAGGYDDKNVENVEHMEELKSLALANSVSSQVTFMPSVSDSVRANLLQSSLFLLYTPSREHFGIVPLESMYAGTPVIAVKSGGPLETVKDGITGFLCDNTPEEFAAKARQLLEDEEMAEEMGRAGHKHVKEKFGLDTFKVSFKRMLEKTIEESQKQKGTSIMGTAMIFFVAFLAILVYSLRAKIW